MPGQAQILQSEISLLVNMSVMVLGDFWAHVFVVCLSLLFWFVSFIFVLDVDLTLQPRPNIWLND